MKKVIVAAAALLCFNLANAQETGAEGFANGNIFISGTAGFSSHDDPIYERKTFAVSPKVGYFVTDNIALGVALGYNGTASEAKESDDDLTVTTLSAGIFGRYYFMPASKFSVYTELAINHLSSKHDVNYDGDYKVNGMGFAITPGVNYFLSNHFALEASFGILEYSSTKFKAGGLEEDNDKDFRIGLDMANVGVGLLYKF